MMNITFESAITAIVALSVLSVFVAIAADFIIYDKKDDVIKSKKSIVATGSMVGFFLVYYGVCRFGLGMLPMENTPSFKAIIITGTSMIVLGAIINVWARLNLKRNWANHIKIYKAHMVVSRGMYKIVRHPLYASIMLMLMGGSLLYRNWLSLLMTIFIFIPFMYYRAKQEETLLESECKDYKIYKQKTGMFFPKIGRGKS